MVCTGCAHSLEAISGGYIRDIHNIHPQRLADMATSSSCVFCRILNREPDTNGRLTAILFEDELVVAFRDIRPATNHHYLVIPKNHVTNPKSLTVDDRDLVLHLHRVGNQLLDERGAALEPNTRLLGYQWPPFNSVPQLHLHATGYVTSMGIMAKAVYMRNAPWFATHDWLLDRLS